MKLFALNDEVAALEAALATRTGLARLDMLAPLAWHCRQRNCAQALKFADEADVLLAGFNGQTPAQKRVAARLLLMRAEVKYLFAELDTAEAMAASALEIFVALDDHIGRGDVHWLMASIWLDRGERQRCDAALEMAGSDYGMGTDTLRVDASVARRLFLSAFTDVGATAAQLEQRFDLQARLDPSVSVWVLSARAIVANRSDDPGASIENFLQVYELANESGQVRQATVAAANAGDNFATLGDLDAALEWDERAMALARRSGWPSMVGGSLLQTGNVLRRLGRFNEARGLFEEAVALLKPLAGSRNCAISFEYLGELALDAGHPNEALDWFRQAEEASEALRDAMLRTGALSGLASALSRLGRPQEAYAKVVAALAQIKGLGQGDRQIEVLRTAAELYRNHDLPPPPEMSAASPALHFLNEALAVAASISGYVVSGEFLEEVAAAHAAVGDFRQAYDYARRSAEALASSRLREAENRAVAMRIRQETERARAEAEYHRQLAKTERERAAELQQSSTTLETLGLIGCEITASLDADAVYAALYNHVNQLLDVTSFDIYLIAADGSGLRGAFSIEDGEPTVLEHISFDDPHSFTVRCASERRELVIDLVPEEANPYLVPGTQQTLSLLFAPLMIGERLLGVMSIQSVLAHVYGERERAIFRTLCAYGAIALDNAGAYTMAQSARAQADQALTSLRDTQARLLQSEKMAALGKVVAGISHELNTPLGNSLMAVTTLRGLLAEFEQSITTTGLRRTELEGFVAAASAGIELALRSLTRSVGLVSSFKQLATERNSIERSRFRLQDAVNEFVVVIGSVLMATPYRLEIDVPEGLQLDSFPEALATTLHHLVGNAITHGFDGRDHGVIQIIGDESAPERIRLRVIDDGKGIGTDDQPRIFDPFFTTKLGKGGSGLGLHLSHNTVTQILGGTLTVISTAGAGSEFVLDLPCVAPRD